MEGSRAWSFVLALPLRTLWRDDCRRMSDCRTSYAACGSPNETPGPARRLRVSEFTALSADAVAQIGAAPGLHVRVGKLREDRYLLQHPQLGGLIEQYRRAHVADGQPLLLPRENGRALDRHTVTRFLNKAGAAAGLRAPNVCSSPQ